MGQNAKLQTAILSDNWNVGFMFGDDHLSAKRHLFSSTIRLSLHSDVLVLLEQLTG